VAGGTTNAGGNFVCQTTKINNRDAASFTTLKTRQATQAAPDERASRKEYREDLEKKEQKARDERDGVVREPDSKKQKKEERFQAVEDNPFPEDADDAVASASEKSDDDDDDEDTEELMRELAKIKKEREEEEERKKEETRQADERSRRDEVMKGNPLVHGAPADVSLKRSWDDDTVFKNQARTAPKEKNRYINDAVRSDFHKKFMNKYVWIDGTAH